ncbi:ectonucleotide pyrophosphatase/phosphodiesterase [Nonlabens sp.]|uniref:alkaline phosphatase family protein n=1 Tax=Nonlabens sp. TaxID=1888209 RepID=UPI001BCAB44C|nr:ectonucleotide pyrophosphatase/phosphodiesterase [Nonlabens sp.]
MTKQYRNITLIAMLGMFILVSCSSRLAPTEQKATASNSESALNKPYVILISLDGFRWDYVNKYRPPNFIEFISKGVEAEALIPSYPSKTFPNHYTIATGMYPDNHGIIGNIFYNYDKQVTYNIRNRKMAEDGNFYGGSPIWIEANKAAMVTASYFFVGTEANIQGITPTYYYKYDGSVKNKDRIAQAVQWLKMPAKKRPHLITMYFSDMDDVGHSVGPSNEEQIKNKLLALDKNLGDLFKGVAATGLPVNILIVSDHGMADQSIENLIPIDDIQNDSLFSTINNGSIVNIHPKETRDTNDLFEDLKRKEQHFKVYKTEDTPGFEKTPTNKDWGPIQLVPDLGYYFSTKKSIAEKIEKNITTIGVHGFDTTYKDMHGIFYAKGPAFKNNYEIPAVKNIHIYPLMCKLLGLDIPEGIDGDLEQIKSVLTPFFNKEQD